jgi:2,3-bisphosphoglycerate-independent phosphoglycerate mutase
MLTKGISKKVLLVICDGLGFSQNTVKNAVKEAHTPTLDDFVKSFPNTTLEPGGVLVGLPKGVAGNSEVGHMNIGAGRPVRQDLVRINEAIEKKTFTEMEEFKKLIEHTKKTSNRLHLMGLLSDGGVHSHIDHIKYILKSLENKGIEVFFHAFMDGRDTVQTNGLSYIKELKEAASFTFASMQGRSIGMDRDRRWEKIELAYTTMTGHGKITSKSPETFIQDQYSEEIFDEFITPVLLDEDAAIKKDDSIFFINFRPDRAKQISQCFCDKKFPYFKNSILPSRYLCMSPYIDEEFPEVPILFNREKVKGTLSEFLEAQGLKQLKIAETEKYAHVTYFFNGGREVPFNGEERVLINSPRDVETYDLKPEMSAPQVLESLLAKLSEDKSVFIVNFANPDMVGHTGKFDATVKAVESIDHCLRALQEKCFQEDIAMLVTADHGNCDQMTHPDGSPHTSHSNAHVPFILIHKDLENVKVETKKENNALMDISPTIVHLLGLEKPLDFVGETIFK